MSRGAYIGIDNVARRIRKGYIGIDNVARKITKGYIGVDNVARDIFGQETRTYKLSTSVTKSDLAKWSGSGTSAQELTVVYKDGTKVDAYYLDVYYFIEEDDMGGVSDEKHSVNFEFCGYDEQGYDSCWWVEQYYDIDASIDMTVYDGSNYIDKIILTRPIDEYSEDFLEFLNVIALESDGDVKQIPKGMYTIDLSRLDLKNLTIKKKGTRWVRFKGCNTEEVLHASGSSKGGYISLRCDLGIYLCEHYTEYYSGETLEVEVVTTVEVTKEQYIAFMHNFTRQN